VQKAQGLLFFTNCRWQIADGRGRLAIIRHME
jgi:hypothetical protein